MPHLLDNPPQTFSRNRDDQYACMCGQKFRTYRDWEKHKAEQNRRSKVAANN